MRLRGGYTCRNRRGVESNRWTDEGPQWGTLSVACSLSGGLWRTTEDNGRCCFKTKDLFERIHRNLSGNKMLLNNRIF